MLLKIEYNFGIMLLEPRWWNWYTRRLEEPGSFLSVRVRVPPWAERALGAVASATGLHPVGRGFESLSAQSNKVSLGSSVVEHGTETPGCRQFDSAPRHHKGAISSVVEQRPLKPCVPGSNPGWPS